MVCHKATQGYGVFHDGVVCSRKCNDAFMATRPSLIDYQPGERNAKPPLLPGSSGSARHDVNASEGSDT